jgi:hypothetical protein
MPSTNPLPEVDDEKTGDDMQEEEREEDMLENRTDWPPIYMPTPSVPGGNIDTVITTTDSGNDRKVKVTYDGGLCTMHMRFVSGGGATSCACFAGKTRAVLGAKATRAVLGAKLSLGRRQGLCLRVGSARGSCRWCALSMHAVCEGKG